jgi:hypothetical protein
LRLEVNAAVVMNIGVFWDVTPYKLVMFTDFSEERVLSFFNANLSSFPSLIN